MISEAIILAGGLGTRLRSAVPDLPKCMAPVNGRPFISYVIDYYYRLGTEKFIFSVGYMHEVIVEYLQEHYHHVNYITSVEDEPLGTGGAIYKACALTGSEDVLILNGDTFFKIDPEDLNTFHKSHHAECTICLKEMTNTDRYGVVNTDESGKIVAFREKQFYERSVINGGVYALNVPMFTSRPMPQKFSFEKDYFERHYSEGKIFGIKQRGYFIDIGIPEDYSKAQEDFKNF